MAKKIESFIPKFTKTTIPGYVASLGWAFGAGMISSVAAFEGTTVIDGILNGWRTSIEAKGEGEEKEKAKKAYNLVVDLMSGGIRSLEAMVAGGIGNAVMKRKFFTPDMMLISLIAGYAGALTISKTTATKL